MRKYFCETVRELLRAVFRVTKRNKFVKYTTLIVANVQINKIVESRSLFRKQLQYLITIWTRYTLSDKYYFWKYLLGKKIAM